MCAKIDSMVIAADGGGTHCRLVLEGPHGRQMVELGPANVSSNFNAAIREIEAGLEKLADSVGMTRSDLFELPAYLGLAGVTDDGMAAQVAGALSLKRVRVEDDRRAALRGALGDRDGAIAHFGTGSFFALQAGGRHRLAGGWGWRLGDEGSAYWVGRAALAATLDTVDGLIGPSGLTDDLLSRFETPGGIVAYAAAATPAQIGSLAKRVTAAATRGDVIANRILSDGATHASRVLSCIGWQPGMALCLTGGIGPFYRDYLPAELQEGLVPPAAAPIDGAVALARAFAEELAS